MDLESEIMEQKGKLRLNDLKMEAIINILTKEGVITHEEVNLEIERLIKEGKLEE